MHWACIEASHLARLAGGVLIGRLTRRYLQLLVRTKSSIAFPTHATCTHPACLISALPFCVLFDRELENSQYSARSGPSVETVQSGVAGKLAGIGVWAEHDAIKVSSADVSIQLSSGSIMQIMRSICVDTGEIHNR